MTIFLFNRNAAAYAGFIFLCETVSLFTLYIILNKMYNDEILIKKYLTLYKNILLFVTVIFYFIIFKKSIQYYNQPITNWYINEIPLNNDFVAVASLFYNNHNHSALIISFFLIIYSCFVIISVQFLNYGVTRYNDVIRAKKEWDEIVELMSANNFIQFKKKIVINYFKKLC